MRRWLSGACAGALAGTLPSCDPPTTDGRSVQDLWFEAQSGFTRARPIVVEDVVFFGSGDGDVIARRVESGDVVWRTAVVPAGQLQGAQLVASSGVICASGLREVAGLDLASGAIKWRYVPPLDTTNDRLPGNMNAVHMTADSGTVYIPAWGASVSAVSLAAGTLRWVWRLGRMPSDTETNVFRSGAVGVVVTGDTLLVNVWHWTMRTGGDAESVLVALDRRTGAELWKVALPSSSVRSTPMVAGALAIVHTQHGELIAVDRGTRAIVWRFQSGAFRYTTDGQAVAVGNVVYTDGGDERLYAVRASDGGILWSTPTRGATRDLFASDKNVYLPAGDRLYIVGRSSGSVTAIVVVKSADEIMESAAYVLAGRVFVTTTNGAWSFREP